MWDCIAKDGIKQVYYDSEHLVGSVRLRHRRTHLYQAPASLSATNERPVALYQPIGSTSYSTMDTVDGLAGELGDLEVEADVVM